MQLSARRRLVLATVLVSVVAGLPGAGSAEDEPGRHRWDAEPAWIANLGVYRHDEVVFQDYVYDDHGANTDGLDRTDLPFGAWPDPGRPTDPRFSPTGGFTRHTGDFMYPADGDGLMRNVADLIEFRVAAGSDDVFYHLRLGDMTTPDSAVVGICADTDLLAVTGVQSWPHGAGLVARLGCDHILTAWGTGATVTTEAGTTDLAALGGEVSADPAEATIDLRVPAAVADPGRARWRYYVGSGVWDAGAGSWLQVPPVPQAIGADAYTGGGVGVPQIWDLLANNREPNSYWMEEKQANDLVRHFVSDDFVDVDFARLDGDDDDGDGAPRRTGFMQRIYRSEHPMSPARGIIAEGGPGSNFTYLGPYQPYAMVVPSNYYDEPRRAFPFDLCLHPLNGNHMVEVYYGEAFYGREGYNPLVTGTVPQTGYLGFSQIEGQADRLGTLYACVLGRGEGVGYTGGNGLVDALEVQADVKRRFRVDPERVTLHGVSLGAIGSWYVSQLYPDRYAAVMPYIFSPGIVNSGFPLLGNLHNLPVTYAIGTLDQFAQGTQGDPTADAMEREGNEYLYLHYLGRQHEGRIEADFMPFTERLAYPARRVTNPARVRYTFDPARFSPKIPGDGSAYWVSGMAPRAQGRAAMDVTSLGRADQLPTDQVVVDGLYTNTSEGWQARIRGLFRMSPEEFRAMWRPEVWEPGWVELQMEITPSTFPPEEIANAFRYTSTNLGAATLDTERMRLRADRPIAGTLEGDGPTTLTLLGEFADGTTATLDGAPVPVTRTEHALVLTLDLSTSGPHALAIG